MKKRKYKTDNLKRQGDKKSEKKRTERQKDRKTENTTINKKDRDTEKQKDYLDMLTNDKNIILQ
jgi:hypothetical protein